VKRSALLLLVVGVLGISCRAAPSDSCSTLPWDAQITHDVNHWGDSTWHTVSAVVSDALIPITFGVPVGMYIYGHTQIHYYTTDAEYRYASETGLQGLVAEILTYGVAWGVKALSDRDRPYKAWPDCIDGYQSPLGKSFPSGHAAGSAALATTLSIRYPVWYVIAPSVTYALLTGAARLHLGVHYLTDVLAGYALGAGMAILVNSLNSYLFELADPILPTDDYTIAPQVNIPLVNISIPF
jgi:membrane-associated phospholipid phosphatase